MLRAECMLFLYAEVGRNLSFQCVSGKVGQGRPESKDCSGCLASAILTNINVLAQVVGVLEPWKNRKVCQHVLAVFAKVKVTIFHLACKTNPRCITVHDNVPVVVIVCEIWAFNFFFKCVSQTQKLAPKVCSGGYHVTVRLTVKFRSNWLRFGGVIPEKMISYNHNICFRYIIIIPSQCQSHRTHTSRLISFQMLLFIGHH